ncbi:MAG: class I SAM-dependent DNA methyltransferase [Fibrobacteria bacterium]
MTQSEIVSFLLDVANLIRDTFKRGKYQDVILPLTVLRRLDCVLAKTKAKVLETDARLKEKKLENRDGQLRKAAGFAFYNTSKFDFEKLSGDAPALAANLRHYIAGFSPNMREVIEKFDFDNTLSKLKEANLLFQVLERFKAVDLHPDQVDNSTMGSIFEELIRKFNEALDENPGEHFTPRDVVHLMVDLLLAGEESRLRAKGAAVTICDPCCGTGGMLAIAIDHVRLGTRYNGNILKPAIAPDAEIHLFGQEVNPETYAVCKSDFFLKSPSGREADNIQFGSTLSSDKHPGQTFDYQIANPPYGKDWKRDKQTVEEEYERGASGRFGAGLPRISDGQLLFLQHMIAHMRDKREGGARVAIIMNGSPLFTGDAGSGESEIRRWVFENDWLESLIALPEQMFYNTGIATYIWVLTNKKASKRKGKVQLIDASGSQFWKQIKNMGAKRREIPFEKAQDILGLYRRCEEGEHSRFFPTTHFGFRKITVERPLRLNFQVSSERLARLPEEGGFRNLAISNKKTGSKAALAEEAEGRNEQDAILALLRSLPNAIFMDRAHFNSTLEAAFKKDNRKLSTPVRKAILSALSERDETAEICRDEEGRPEPDPELRDTENVPLAESIEAYFDREVIPHVPDAWIDRNRKDEKDKQVGIVGYEINFNREFYKYVPPRPLEEIDADIRAIEKDIVRLLAEVTGSGNSAEK